MKRNVRTVCQGCHCECGVLVLAEGGKIKKVEGDPEHPMNKGYICIKGRAYPQFVHHSDRLKYPLKKVSEKGLKKWKRVSWDEALNSIVRKFSEIKEKHGSESIAFFHGTAPRTSLVPTTLLSHALGSPNKVSTDLHICYAPSIIAEFCTIGESIMMESGPDYENANCIVVWGGNPLISHPPRGREIMEAKQKRKAKLIVIDPRRTRLASKADLWLQIRPGVDDALALGMINTIINEKLYDRKFVEEWCYGFDKLKERAVEFPAERVEKITWVPAEKIKKAARIYASTKPAVLHHRVAIEHNINSVQTDRALIILIALTGNIDVKGGNVLPSYPRGYVKTGLIFKKFKLDPEIKNKCIGAQEYPLASGPDAPFPFVNSLLAIEAILSGSPYHIKAAYCAGGNPVINCQNTKRVVKALKNLELLVVADFFMTPTAELADYVLPTATWPETDRCCDRAYTNFISARQRVIDPLYECWDDLKIAIELVKRIPWADRKFLPWNSVDEYNEWRVKDMGISFENFKKKGYIIEFRKFRKYEEKGFGTPTGKTELYSTIFEKHGYDPLPNYKEPPESPIGTPDLMKEYPFILITGGRHIEYFHSEGRQIPRLRELMPDPEVEIHPDSANETNIKNGDWIWIETPRVKGERVKFKAKLTSDIHPKVVHARHGWWFPEKPAPEHGCFDSNINVVTSGPPEDRICGSVPTRGTLCRIYKLL